MTDMPDFRPLEERLGHTFRDQSLLLQALTHRSYLNEHSDFAYDHNERLEFLGDAVLELVVTEHLYRTFANPEGDLTNWRAALVNAKTLASIGQDLKFEEYLLLSKGEARDKDSKARMYILANAMESLIGAIYLDGKMEAAEKFIHAHILMHLPRILELELYRDAKSKFQETAQELLGITPTYRVLEESGPKTIYGWCLFESRPHRDGERNVETRSADRRRRCWFGYQTMAYGQNSQFSQDNFIIL